MATRAEAMRAAGQVLADARARLAALPSVEIARQAAPGGDPDRIEALADYARRLREKTAERTSAA